MMFILKTVPISELPAFSATSVITIVVALILIVAIGWRLGKKLWS